MALDPPPKKKSVFGFKDWAFARGFCLFFERKTGSFHFPGKEGVCKEMFGSQWAKHMFGRANLHRPWDGPDLGGFEGLRNPPAVSLFDILTYFNHENSSTFFVLICFNGLGSLG